MYHRMRPVRGSREANVGYRVTDSSLQDGQYQPVLGGPGSISIHTQPSVFGSMLRHRQTVRCAFRAGAGHQRDRRPDHPTGAMQTPTGKVGYGANLVIRSGAI
jgi:hypothetical protein